MATAKTKTKKSVMDTTVTEARPGVWAWSVGAVNWQYDTQSRVGLNLAAAFKADPEQAWQDVLFCKTLEHAIMFTWGYNAGTEAAAKTAK